jgi:bifunctional DNA-binding transcriptional regulator/antitoxin component of YhaV-PrlF toxin-antitoxin module
VHKRREEACEGTGRSACATGIRVFVLTPIDGLRASLYTQAEMTAIVKTKTPLTVPDAVRRRAGFKPGDRVEFKVARGVVTVTIRATKRRAAHDTGDTLTPAEARKVRHAIKQVREGKTTPWPEARRELGL